MSAAVMEASLQGTDALLVRTGPGCRGPRP
jgi:hypothetical protein